MACLRGQAVTLLGAGTQGTRLAYMWSRCGRPVHLIDKSPAQLDRARRDIQNLRNNSSPFATSLAKDVWGSLTCAAVDGLEAAVLKSWLVVECVPETLLLKRSVIKQLDEVAMPQTIVASNSSSYTITEILDGMQVKSPDRLASLHSYWPPETPAIEVMGSRETRPDIISLLMTETAAHGFQPFYVRKSSMGYIYNRIWAAIKRETLLALGEGVATPEEIDEIFKAVLKAPKGPCEQMDTVGLDVVLDIEKHYAEARKNLPEEPQNLLKEMLAQGQLGVKSGRGFFAYQKNDSEF